MEPAQKFLPKNGLPCPVQSLWLKEVGCVLIIIQAYTSLFFNVHFQLCEIVHRRLLMSCDFLIAARTRGTGDAVEGGDPVPWPDRGKLYKDEPSDN